MALVKRGQLLFKGLAKRRLAEWRRTPHPMTQEGREGFIQSVQPVVDPATHELIASILAAEGSGLHTLQRELGDQQYFDLLGGICGLELHGKLSGAPLHLTLKNPSAKQGG